MRTERRTFLKSTGFTALAGGFFPGSSASKTTSSPNEKLNIALVGTQNRASSNIRGVSGENIVAMCDVDKAYLEMRATEYPDTSTYRDFRKMLDKEHKNIDAVVVSTADHTHAPATAAALRLGKHVYCEKPLTHTVHEARVIAHLAEKAGVATQMGTQIHAGGNYRRVVELIRSGAIGAVKDVHVWCNKDWGGGRFRFGKLAPARLDWDLWLGPAKEIRYSDGLHPGNWRRFWDFGSGTCGDMGCHIMDVVQWALDLDHPTTVWAEGPPVDPVGAPKWLGCHYEFPQRGRRAPVKLHWYDGGHHPEITQRLTDSGGRPLSQKGLGALFVGEKGMLFVDYGSRVLMPAEEFAGFEPPAQTIPDSIGHYQEWIRACKTGSPTTCNFTYAGMLTETVLLGTVAYRCGEKLQWDAPNLRATNVAAASEFIQKDYRDGWEL